MNTSTNWAPAPPGVASRFIRYLLAFGVSVGVALAPFLGKLHIPLFEPLLRILPPTEHAMVIPMSAALMGIVAVLVQWYAYDRLPKRQLGRWFGVTAALAVTALLTFYVVNTMVVTRVPVGQDDMAVLLHGFGDAKCQECSGKSNVECMRHISFDPGRVEACWGSSSVQKGRTILTMTYLAATSLFAALVGFLVVGGRDGRKR